MKIKIEQETYHKGGKSSVGKKPIKIDDNFEMICDIGP